jgi:hypothetical protein
MFRAHMVQLWVYCCGMKKSTTKNTTNVEPVTYAIERRRKLRIYWSRDELPELPDKAPNFEHCPNDTFFPIIWMDYDASNVGGFLEPPKQPTDYWEYLNVESVEVLEELQTRNLTNGGLTAATTALGLAQKFGFLQLDHYSDSRGEPVESWIAVGKGVNLFLEIADGLNQINPSPQELRSLMGRYTQIAHEHLPGMAFTPANVWDNLDNCPDDELEKFARQALTSWVQSLPKHHTQNFRLEVKVVDGQIRSQVVARNFLAALAVFMSRYLMGESKVRRCKNLACKLWFTKKRVNDEFGGIDSQGKKNCGVYNLRSQPCPYAREKSKSVTNL